MPNPPPPSERGQTPPAGAPHKVAVHAYEEIAAFELGVVVEVFALPRPELEVEQWYDFALFSETPGRLGAVGGFGLDVPHGLEALDDAGTVILLGSPDPYRDPPAELLDALRAGRIEAAIVESVSALSLTETDRRFAIVASLTFEPYVLAMPVAAYRLQAEVDRVMEHLRTEGFVERLNTRWFGGADR